MLNLWYSEKCTREIKLVVCIVTCVIIYFCSNIAPLKPLDIGLCLVTGVLMHVIYQSKKKLSTKNKYAEGFQILFFIFPILLINFMIISTPKIDKVWLIIQSLGFICLGLFIVSIYENRAKRFT